MNTERPKWFRDRPVWYRGWRINPPRFTIETKLIRSDPIVVDGVVTGYQNEREHQVKRRVPGDQWRVPPRRVGGCAFGTVRDFPTLEEAKAHIDGIEGPRNVDMEKVYKHHLKGRKGHRKGTK